jgi:hypothetical protein
LQKRAPDASAAPQREHSPAASGVPHAEQNFPVAGAPHDGQKLDEEGAVLIREVSVRRRRLRIVGDDAR